MSKLKLGILFGGISEEHPVSVKSAREVAKSLDPDKYDPYWIGITTAGAWTLCDGPTVGWEDTGRPVVLSPDRTVHGLLAIDQQGVETIRLDVLLPVLHGRLGEDGAMQGLMELSGVPYVGCDVPSSAVCMDKSLAYTIARSAGIATPNFWILDENSKPDAEVLTYPVFVKPARSGSSFGVSKVTTPDELRTALAEARQYDTKVLIEQAVIGAEIGCAVLGERFGPITGEVDRVALTHGFFRIHQEATPETGSENSSFIVPADIPGAAREQVKEAAKAVYTALSCKGLARVDMFLTETGEVILNEVNTLPGLTSYSRYPRMMAAAGLPLSEVIDRLVAMTLTGRRR
jgi:D-alanine--(R)-lactate ligase